MLFPTTFVDLLSEGHRSLEDVFSSSPMKKAIDFASVVSVLEAWKREELGLMDDLRLGRLIGMNMVDTVIKRNEF